MLLSQPFSGSTAGRMQDTVEKDWKEQGWVELFSFYFLNFLEYFVIFNRNQNKIPKRTVL